MQLQKKPNKKPILLALGALFAEGVAAELNKAKANAIQQKRSNNLDALLWLTWWWSNKVCRVLNSRLEGATWWED